MPNGDDHRSMSLDEMRVAVADADAREASRATVREQWMC